MKVLLWCGLWLFAIGAYAEDSAVQMNDYAFGLPIEISSEAAIYRLAIPEVVYTHLTQSDYSDLRVFNAAGEVVPHSLRRPAAPEADAGDPLVVPFFPYAIIKPGDHSPVLVQVTINDQGTVVRSGTTEETTGEQQVSAYLIDVSALKDMPSRLEFSWEGHGDSFVTHVSIEGSDDLSDWHSLVPQASLVRLNYADHKLGRNEIDLPNRTYKYLKLNWPAAAEGVRLTEVRSWFTQSAEPVEPVWVELTGTVVEGERESFVYHGSGRSPFEWAEIGLPEDNSFIDVRLFSRDNKAASWRVRHSGSFYRLQVDGTKLASDAARISPLTDRHWRLETVSDLSGLGATVPVLRLGYVPHQLHFLARGEAPFVLAFAAHETAVVKSQINILLSRINEENSDSLIGEVYAGDLMILGGKDRLQAPPLPFPWQQFMLWGVLLIGVIVLGTMVWRLAKQMR